MPTLAALDLYLTINTVDLRDHSTEINLNMSRDELEETTFGDTTKGFKPGLKDWELSVTMFQDYAASKVDATIWPLIDNGTSFAIELRPVNNTVSTTNPKYTSTTAYAFSYSNPVGGTIGQMASTQIKIKPGKGGNLVRGTS